MKLLSKKSKTYKVFNALYNGATLTSAQAKHRYGVGNLGTEVFRIRNAGWAVYTQKRVAGNGVKVTEYVLGKPSREIVALGYKAKSMGITL